jgi:hypothetical protein
LPRPGFSKNAGKKLCGGGILVNQRQRLLSRLLLVSGCCALVSGTVHAQFGGKQYQQWTVKEAEGLLVNSAWAQTRAGLVAVGRLDPPTAAANTAVTIRLRSALPLRQALVRLRQLKNKYDTKSDSDKAAIDGKNRPLLECPECADYYMVTVSPGPGSSNALSTNLPLNTVSLAWLKLNVEIKNEKGETRELVKFIKEKFFGDEAVFFFSRFNSKGEPLISPANRTFTISFDPHVFGWKTWTVTRFEFDVAKMISNGKVVF